MVSKLIADHRPFRSADRALQGLLALTVLVLLLALLLSGDGM